MKVQVNFIIKINLIYFINSIDFTILVDCMGTASLVDYFMQIYYFMGVIKLTKIFLMQQVDWVTIISRLIMIKLVQELVYYQIKMMLNSIVD